jgi:hypothetical protein
MELKMVKLVNVSVNKLSDMFELDRDRLYRVGSLSARFKHQSKVDVTNQVSVRVGSVRIKTSRVIFALENGYMPNEYLLLDDDDKYVEVNRHIHQMFAYKNMDKVLDRGGKYIARWFNKDFKRESKKFDSYDEAYSYQRDMINTLFGSMFKELNIYNKYFN